MSGALELAEALLSWRRSNRPPPSLCEGEGRLLAEALLDGLPRPVEGLCDLRPGSALRASLLDRSTLNLLQDLLHFRKRVENHERLVARPNAEHRLSVATQDFLRNPLNHPGVIEIIGGGRVHALMLSQHIWLDESVWIGLRRSSKIP